MAVPSFVLDSQHGLLTRTNIVINKPTGTADNDIIFFAVGMANSAGGVPPTPTPPAGLTQLGSVQSISAGSLRTDIYMYWKRAASEGTTYTWTHASTLCFGFAATYRGCVTTESPIGTTYSVNTGSGTTATANSITTPSNDNIILYVNANLNGTSTLSPPSGMTERADSYLYYAELAQTTAGATGNKTQTMSDADPWIANLFALKSLADPVSSITGTLAATIDPITLASDADLLIGGTLSKTIDPVTVSASGDLLINGTLAATIDPVTLAGSGNLVLAGGSGTLNVTIDPVTVSSNADLIIKGQLAATIDPVTLAAAGSITQPAITGTLNVTIGPVTLSAFGSETGIPSAPGGIPYWGPSGGPLPGKKRKKYKAPPRPSGAHIPEKELKRAVKELLAREAGKEVEARKKPKALAREIVAEIPPSIVTGLARKEAVAFVAKELREELPQTFYSEAMIRDNEKLVRAILLILRRLFALAAQARLAAEEEEEELIALLLSAA